MHDRYLISDTALLLIGLTFIIYGVRAIRSDKTPVATFLKYFLSPSAYFKSALWGDQLKKFWKNGILLLLIGLIITLVALYYFFGRLILGQSLYDTSIGGF